jgi:hypothetical protein
MGGARSSVRGRGHDGSGLYRSDSVSKRKRILGCVLTFSNKAEKEDKLIKIDRSF